jgi:hypothetical protein
MIQQFTSLTKEMVKQTSIYENLDDLQKKILLSNSTFEFIRVGYNISEYKGLEYWKEGFYPQERVYNVVKELRWNKDGIPDLDITVMFKIKGSTTERIGKVTLSGVECENTLVDFDNIIAWQKY